VDDAPPDRDSINKAKVRAEMRVKVAGFIDREAWGDKGQQVNVQVNVDGLHLDSLRHRMIEASVPLAVALKQTGNLALVAGSSPSDSEGNAAPLTCGTEEPVS
jgi:hypothetical protein